MTEKDPKDMAASELLRWSANGEKDEYGSFAPHHKLLAALSGKAFEDSGFDEDSASFLALADKIDGEIAEVKEKGHHLTAEPLAETVAYYTGLSANGVESIERWLDRWFVPRPRYEDGEPVQFGDEIEIYGRYGLLDAGLIQSFHPNKGTVWILSLVGCDHEHLVRFDPETCVIRRPASRVPGFDGKPVVAGETVWDTESGKKLSVCAIANADAGMIQCSDDTGDCEDYDARHLTHTPPDTQERIDADAAKKYVEYWGCVGVSCTSCPAKIDGEKPWERYGVYYCEQAQTINLLRRQRELDARRGGE